MTRPLARVVVSSLLLASSVAFAEGDRPPPDRAAPEPEVLIGRLERNGGWGAPVFHVTTVRDRAAMFLGGRGGWLINGRLTLGGGGFGLVTRIPAPPAVGKAGEDLDLQMGYGGGWVEYTFAPLRLVHVSVGTLVGAGGLSLTWHDGGAYGSGSDTFFVAEPAVVAELNLATFMRVDLGAAYRWTVGAKMPGLSYADVAGFSVVAAVKFGRF